MNLHTIPLSPYPYRNGAPLAEFLHLDNEEIGDFSPSGFMRIIRKLELVSHLYPWAKHALNAERRAYMILHGDVKPYNVVSELASPCRRSGELELEFLAAKEFHHVAS